MAILTCPIDLPKRSRRPPRVELQRATSVPRSYGIATTSTIIRHSEFFRRPVVTVVCLRNALGHHNIHDPDLTPKVFRPLLFLHITVCYRFVIRMVVECLLELRGIPLIGLILRIVVLYDFAQELLWYSCAR